MSPTLPPPLSTRPALRCAQGRPGKSPHALSPSCIISFGLSSPPVSPLPIGEQTPSSPRLSHRPAWIPLPLPAAPHLPAPLCRGAPPSCLQPLSSSAPLLLFLSSPLQSGFHPQHFIESAPVNISSGLRVAKPSPTVLSPAAAGPPRSI